MSGAIPPNLYKPSWCAPELDGKKNREYVHRKVHVYPPKINKPHVN
jgi:hypothetical protein